MAGEATDKPIAVVTGASAGIGLHTAAGLARGGMRVVMVGRSKPRLETARRFVVEQVPDAKIEAALADFSALDEVRALATEILARHDRIDVLVNNAGLISRRYAVSAEGYELTIAVNHLAPFLLTNLLLERLRASTPARVVTVASQAHRGAKLDPMTMTRPRDWTPLSAYGRSKLANILFTRALARRLHPTAVTASCLHPGVIATDIGDRAGTLAGLGWRLAKTFLPGPDKGARTSIFLATIADPTPFHGAYVIGKAITEPDAAARDEALAEQLWEESARLVGL
ncbi:MAG TPA: SDR family NAD(P)-dependent oxidoreductase [Stellaceae bacterium]|nr:SDR family NAD(P)-dependent oxidoreductase [Stellaceae bacterium]